MTELLASGPVAIATAVFYTVFRFAEDHLVNPLTMKYVLRIHPAAMMLAVLAGGTLPRPRNRAVPLTRGPDQAPGSGPAPLPRTGL